MPKSVYHVGLVGITGYAGMELARLLAQHPSMRLTMACSRAESGKRLGSYYPFLETLPGCDVCISSFNADEAAKSLDLVFLAVPAGTAFTIAPDLLAKGVKVVDFSADFRIHEQAVYETWYKQTHTAPHLLSKAVYGLPERYAKEIQKADLVANPGCYPTSIILGLAPALQHHCIQANTIVIDAKSGTTGAGRKASVANLFCEVSDTFRAYGLVSHRHTPEIEQELGLLAKTPLTVQFSPHLVPMNRGILSTIYADLADPSLTLDTIHQIYSDAWANEPWIRVLPKGRLPETRFVRGSMFCDIGLAVDPRTKRLIVVSVIDNLCRGAAGQALANANLMLGLPVDTGLANTAPLF
ncbi:MAG: N-acetyl-gamma-glutamyl-phosphate reductase [Desulfovibrio sp.]|nr:N-acetyl-gamma-glutamyl-phosphate reductase [Desulfovibrio sp.]